MWLLKKSTLDIEFRKFYNFVLLLASSTILLILPV